MNGIKRTYTERNYQKFERLFKKEYPEIYRAIQDNVSTGGASPIIFALYESSIVEEVMK